MITHQIHGVLMADSRQGLTFGSLDLPQGLQRHATILRTDDASEIVSRHGLPGVIHRREPNQHVMRVV